MSPWRSLSSQSLHSYTDRSTSTIYTKQTNELHNKTKLTAAESPLIITAQEIHQALTQEHTKPAVNMP